MHFYRNSILKYILELSWLSFAQNYLINLFLHSFNNKNAVAAGRTWALRARLIYHGEILPRNIHSMHAVKNRAVASLECCKAKDPTIVAELQEAWKALRWQHPQIAVLLNETGSRVTYTVPSPEVLETWVHDTFTVCLNPDDSAESLNPTLAASDLFTLHYFPLRESCCSVLHIGGSMVWIDYSSRFFLQYPHSRSLRACLRWFRACTDGPQPR